MQWWGPGPSQPRSLHSGSQGPGKAKLNDFMEFHLRWQERKRPKAQRFFETLRPWLPG